MSVVSCCTCKCICAHTQTNKQSPALTCRAITKLHLHGLQQGVREEQKESSAEVESRGQGDAVPPHPPHQTTLHALARSVQVRVEGVVPAQLHPVVAIVAHAQEGGDDEAGHAELGQDQEGQQGVDLAREARSGRWAGPGPCGGALVPQGRQVGGVRVQAQRQQTRPHGPEGVEVGALSDDPHHGDVTEVFLL